jgi:putative pyruvate formate lyase activating enzyme
MAVDLFITEGRALSGAQRGSGMDITRRELVRRCLAAGGLVTAFPVAGREGAADRSSWRPAYARLEDVGELAGRIEAAYDLLRRCRLCPRDCRVDRLRGRQGICRGGAEVVVYNFGPHFGEEIPLTGRRGSGTIFFSNCNLRCVFCQNWPIAHEGRGQAVSDEILARIMLDLQRMGCHNINLVTPTHVMPHILQATRLALHQGLRLPLVYNTGGYERPEVIRLLDGVVDIYLPDIKYMDGRQAARYSAGAGDYPAQATASVLEMHRQVGGLVADRDGTALRGLMIRHLVMPNGVAGTRAFVEWVAREVAADTYVNIMPQYRVDYRAFDHPPIARAITPEEFLEAMDWAVEAGLTNLAARSVAQRRVYRRRSG